jgi:xylose dehydrogenase (NAD/NADP)
MPSKVRWGVIGLGNVAKEWFLPALLKAENAELGALASRSPEKLSQFVEMFGLPVKTYSDYTHLLDDPEIDAVYIALPNALHKEWTIKAARRGKHVLCEKPLALKADDCREIIAACRASGVLLMEGFMYRYADRTRKAQELVLSGRLGEIRHIDSCFFSLASKARGNLVDPALGGGALHDLGCYPLNIVGLLANDKPVSISAEAVPFNGVDVVLSAVLKYSSGLLATIHCGWVNESRTLDTTIMGTEGTLIVPRTFRGEAGFLSLITPDGEREEIPVKETDMFLEEITQFSAAVLGRPALLNSLEESVQGVEVMEEILKKAGIRP